LRVKTKLLLIGALFAVLLTLVACKPLLVSTPNPNSFVVQSGLAPTNEPNAVAYLMAAQKINQTYDTSPYAPAVTGLLNGLTAIASAAAGWYARHTTAKDTMAATLLAAKTPPANAPPAPKV
jgi:hypothetical protein